MTTDQTPAVEVLARLLCAADVHVHDGDHPSWQQLRVAQHGRGQDDYRKAARWLLPRMTVATKPAAVPVPLSTQADRRAQLLDALDFAYCQGLGFDTPEALLVAYDASRAVSVPPPADQTALHELIAAAARTVRLRLGPNAVAMAQRGEPIILNLNESDDLADAVLAVVPEQTDRAAVLLEAADFLRDAHFRDGMSVQEIGTAMRHWADRERPAVGEQPETQEADRG